MSGRGHSEMRWWVAHARDVISRTQDAFSRILNCEIYYQGFIATGSREFLEAYQLNEKTKTEPLEVLSILQQIICLKRP